MLRHQTYTWSVLLVTVSRIYFSPAIHKQQKRLNEDGEEIDSDAEDQEPTAAVPDKKKNSRLCSECCSRVAIRACNECGDKFCTKCYKFLHSTGTKFSCVLPYVGIFSSSNMWWSRRGA
jgi:hypothetical protein